ncbi:unnamed protein product [Prorocentrum cordatum]|uniref:Metalloendopeptidase n=1 Tax=Prorocentrum cordatum TaxID=2364126 RepID=A0ABN9VGA6_9DINO|nr:unnamed protein product [Polarella glacialis]
MPRASALIFASLGAASAAGVAPVCARDSALLQARATVSHSPHEGHVRVERQLVGCFPRAAGDTDDQQNFQDTSCVSAASRNSSLEPCRSGMPFFRLPMQKQQSAADCFMFCLSKGLDLSGLMHSERAGLSECRCGATRANRAAWHELTPPPGLLLPNGSADPEDNEHCKMPVWQYTGPLEDGGVPTVLTELSEGDEAYIDGIAVGEDPHEITEEDGAGEGTPTVHPDTLSNLSLLGAKGLCEDHTETGVGNNMPCSQAKTWCNAAGALGLAVRGACPFSCGLCTQAYGWMPCYPNPCSPGGGPWTTKVGNVVYINYYFDNLDADRQAAFNKAKDEWESKTCVRFTYSSATPRMRITVTNQATCSAFVGFPGSDGTLDVNLGWCNSVEHWGNIAHELGHALGMNHEQNRPDGPGQTNTPAGWKGPHLRVKWQNIDTVWRPQWEGQKRSYYGSQTAGYAPYDYGSIMHYGLGDNADATNSAWQSVPGQRDGLSAGDIAQFQDMYQCGSAAPAPAPAPAPTPPPPTPGPAPAGCVDSTENPWGQSCAAWLAQGACAVSNGIRQHCKVSCQQCVSETPAPTPGPAPAGCVDSTENPWGQSCAAWLAQGACAVSNGIRQHCKVSCQQCNQAPTPAPAGGAGCTDRQGELSYGYTCPQWALASHCAGSQTIQADCPGSCAEVEKVTYGYTCAQWHGWGHCANSETLKAECPHICGQCR